MSTYILNARNIIYGSMMQSISDGGKLPVLNRLRELLYEDGDERDSGELTLDVLFVHTQRSFPEDDMKLLKDYIIWLETNFPDDSDSE